MKSDLYFLIQAVISSILAGGVGFYLARRRLFGALAGAVLLWLFFTGGLFAAMEASRGWLGEKYFYALYFISLPLALGLVLGAGLGFFGAIKGKGT